MTGATAARLAGWGLVAAMLAVSAQYDVPQVRTVSLSSCMEDQPCWDGTRMGDRAVGAMVWVDEFGLPRASCPRSGATVEVNDLGVVVCQY